MTDKTYFMKAHQNQGKGCGLRAKLVTIRKLKNIIYYIFSGM